jgi:mevalonate kinase
VVEKKFFAKILLFGEYSVIKNSKALSIPYPLFEGSLKFHESSEAKRVDAELKAFVKYLEKLDDKEKLGFSFDVTSFAFDVGQGLYFDSTIPQGYGAGSSGALCAAIYDRYAKEKSNDIIKLKHIFSTMESHFHGASSGADPLVSFFNRPILFEAEGKLSPVDIPNYLDGYGGIFILNTGRARRTEPLVNLFLEKCNSKDFNTLCTKTLAPITNKCIDSFLKKDIDILVDNFKELSDFQYNYLSPMIPSLYLDIWNEGLEGKDFFFKLCGAGGGGFLLGITRDFKKTKKILSQYEIRPLFRF